MKKILILLLLLSTITPCFADYTPHYANSGKFWGNGLMLFKDKIKIYEKNDENSALEAIINKEEIKEVKNRKTAVENTYIVLSKEKNVMALPVESDTDEWFYVCYDQAKKLFGWVKKDENIDYLSWHDFFNYYGRKYGVYLFRNVPKAYKNLYSAPNEESTLVDSFTYPKHISFWLIGGDWMLVKVITFDNMTKTGWMRWRIDNNNVIAFPDFRNINY